MTKQDENKERTDEDERASHRVRLPGFVGDEDIGLGDVVKRERDITRKLCQEPHLRFIEELAFVSGKHEASC